MRLGAEPAHVGRLAEGVDAARLGFLDRRRAVGVLSQNVGALVDQRLGGGRFLTRIVPAIDPDHADLSLGIDAAERQGEGVDAAHHFGNREGADIADDVRLGQLAGDQAADGPPFVEPARICRDIGGALVAGGMLELHLGEALGDLQRRVHEAERGREDQPVTALGKLLDHPLGIRTLGDVLDIGRFDLIAEMLGHMFAAQVMLIAVAVVGHRTDIDEPDLQLIGGERLAAERAGKGAGGECRGGPGHRKTELASVHHRSCSLRES